MFNTLKRLRVFLPFRKKEVKTEESLSKAVRKIDFDKFQESIHYKIIDKAYFINALTHRSFLKIKKEPSKFDMISNERL